MSETEHKQIVDYIIKVFAPGDHYVDILNKRTLSFEEAFKLMEAYAKDHRGWSWNSI